MLPAEHAGFIEIFLRCEGNLSRVGEALELSYPTVRARLTAALTALGFMEGTNTTTPPPAAVNSSNQRQQILDDLANGRIGADEAAIALSKL